MGWLLSGYALYQERNGGLKYSNLFDLPKPLSICSISKFHFKFFQYLRAERSVRPAPGAHHQHPPPPTPTPNQNQKPSNTTRPWPPPPPPNGDLPTTPRP